MDLLVLAVLRDQETYGYELVGMLADCGLESVNEASVYTSLRRLETKGMLTGRRELADNGKARKYYSLTPEGFAMLKAGVKAWTSQSRAVDKVLANHPVPGTL
jgi:PadR family transcriptional regulator, regulatory protein PadR